MGSSSWPKSLPNNRIKAIQKLTNGYKITNKLRAMIGSPEKIESDIKSGNGVVVQIMGMFDNTLSILRSSNLNSISSHTSTIDVRSSCIWDDQKPKGFDKTTPLKIKRGCFKRRKNASTITTFTSTLVDDGFAWRKYGQKVILNSKHQRNYYRCSHKVEQGCQATKQVQRMDEEPSKYMITYNGSHTCETSQRSQIFLEASSPRDNSFLISFGTNMPMENNNKVGPLFSSTRHTNKEGYFPSLNCLKHEQVSSSGYDHTPWDSKAGLSQLVTTESMSMISELDYENTPTLGGFSPTSGTYGYEIERIIESLDNTDLPFSCVYSM